MNVPQDRGRRVELTYYGGLDGLRALAVIAVVLYHGGVSWAGGGLLGVEVFFVLSGFLITSLLLAEWRRSQAVRLGAFWARRARRLLPALLCLVLVVGLYYALAGPADTILGLRDDGLATLFYFGNWHQIASGSNYFAATGPVSPFKHTWSLAIEEQFYLVWPVLVCAVLWLARRGRIRTSRVGRRPLETLFALSVAGAVASAIEVALLFDGGRGLNRVYYGTDTRAAGLLAGASLAIGLAIAGGRRAHSLAPGRLTKLVLAAAAVPALVGLLVMMYLNDGSSAWMYPFGMVGVDVVVVVLIAAVVLSPRSWVGRAFSVSPLRWIGMISYGIYLWHFPLFLWLDADTIGVDGTPLLLLRLAVTLLVSVLSFVLIEQPIRRRRAPTWLVRSLTPVALGGAVAALIVASAVGSVSVSSAAVVRLSKRAERQLRGTDPPCQVALKDSSEYGLSPPPASGATHFEYTALGEHSLVWSGSSSVTFHTCPPKKVLVVGDSLAFTLGLGMMEDEQRYGVELANAAILGCAFTTAGELDVGGTWEGQSAGCPTELERWAHEERSLNVSAVIVELGYRDQFDWRIDGKVEHLGQPQFDAYVEGQIRRFVQVMGKGGVPILFLSVPWSDPPAQPNGSPGPAASPARHTEIDSMLLAAARGDPNARVLDIDKVVSPAGHYQATIDGQLCRFDGVHFSIFCSRLLEPAVLSTARAMIDRSRK